MNVYGLTSFGICQKLKDISCSKNNFKHEGNVLLLRFIFCSVFSLIHNKTNEIHTILDVMVAIVISYQI